MICPFCGKESTSEDRCTKCHVRFTKAIRAIAYDVDEDPRTDRVGPLSTKAAKIIGWMVLGMLLVVFVVVTELTGNGLTGSGIR